VGAIDGYGIDTAWVLFSGLWQSRLRLSGIERINIMLHCRAGGPTTKIDQWEWSAPTKELVDIYERWTHRRDNLALNVVGYSLGGWKAVEFCREVGRRGQSVKRLFLVDAKYCRHPRLYMASYFDLGKLTVPRNVDRLWAYAQTGKRPRGSPVYYAHPTKLETTSEHLRLRATHIAIDDSPIIRNAILEELNHAAD